jgi:hypothetical protein
MNITTIRNIAWLAKTWRGDIPVTVLNYADATETKGSQ